MLHKLPYISITVIISIVALTGCDVFDDNGDDPARELEGLYVLNQGNFSDGVASITIYDPESDSVEQNAFQNRNGRPLGSVGQSMQQIDELLYTVINNSHKVEIMDAENLQYVETIQFADSLSPRYMIEARDGIGYVTNWAGFGSPGYVSVVDLETYEVLDHIQVGIGPEELAKVGDNVYVANSGFGNGQTISVLNAEQDEVRDHIQVSDNPVNMTVDNSARLWVLCQGATNEFGNPDDDTPAQIYVLNGSNGTKQDSLEIGLDAGSAAHPTGFTLNNQDDLIYLLKGGIHTIDMNNLQVEEIGFITGSFFALEYSEEGEESRIYTTDAKGFDQAGEAYIYDLQGSAVDSFQTAVGPGDFHFAVN